MRAQHIVMKPGDTQLKLRPGDIIEWVHEYDKSPVISDEKLWSTSMQKWVPVGGSALLVGITPELYFWVIDKGFFHARVDDTRSEHPVTSYARVIPRMRG